MTGIMHSKKRILAILLSLSCILTASCGTPADDTASNSGSSHRTSTNPVDDLGNGANATGNEGESEILYVPSFHPLTGTGNGFFRHPETNNGFLYYSVLGTDADGQSRCRFYRQRLTDDGNEIPAEELYTDADTWEELATDTYRFFTDGEGYGYFILRKKETDTSPVPYFLCKYSVSGDELFRREITPEMASQAESRSLFRGAVTDSESRIYIGQGETVCLYDREGNLQAQVPVSGELTGMACGRDGNVYVTCQFNGEYTLGTIDFEKRTLEEICTGFPGDGILSGGTEYDILTMDRENIYGFRAGMDAPEVVLTWTDSDLYGEDITYIHGMEKGTILAVSGSVGKKSQLLFLTPAPADNIPAKEVITLGILHDQSNQELDLLITEFNKCNEHYRIEPIIYGKDCKDLSELNATVNKANMEIITGNSPDLILLDGGMYGIINVDVYVKTGILEDLTDYLENSGVVHREDLLPSALEQFTYGEGLYGIPHTLNLWTIAGRTSEVGTEPGWTIEDMKQLMLDHPDARLFKSCTKNKMLWLLLTYDQKHYVDWLEGTCSFDSEEFRKLLEFANSFPLEQSEDENLTLENGGILLSEETMVSFVHTPLLREKFGYEEITFIGYPGAHGCGTMLGVSNALGISSLSGHKEGAWEFLEFTMTNNPMLERRLGSGFPVNKELLERYFLFNMALDYVYDNEGNLQYDENGDPLTWISLAVDPESFPDQDDVDTMRQLIETAEPMNLSTGNLSHIICEEAAPYFYGQKTLDEVVDIIQRRVQLRVSE